MKNYTLLITFFLTTQLISAQCYPDRHNTTWYDAWTSCQPAPNPNTALGSGHWILYNLGRAYKLKASYFWNANEPTATANGLQDIRIDYSLDGISWTYFDNFTLDRATGSTRYQGQPGPDFGEVEAQYVLLTANSNYGGPCYSLSELKINVDQIIISSTDQINKNNPYCFNAHISPNPFNDETKIHIKSNCHQTLYYSITDALGKIVMSQRPFVEEYQVITLSGKDFYPGMYYLIVTDGYENKSYSFVKID